MRTPPLYDARYYAVFKDEFEKRAAILWKDLFRIDPSMISQGSGPHIKILKLADALEEERDKGASFKEFKIGTIL